MDSYVQLYWSLCVVGGLVGLAAGIGLPTDEKLE